MNVWGCIGLHTDPRGIVRTSLVVCWSPTRTTGAVGISTVSVLVFPPIQEGTDVLRAGFPTAPKEIDVLCVGFPTAPSGAVGKPTETRAWDTIAGQRRASLKEPCADLCWFPTGQHVARGKQQMGEHHITYLLLA